MRDFNNTSTTATATATHTTYEAAPSPAAKSAFDSKHSSFSSLSSNGSSSTLLSTQSTFAPPSVQINMYNPVIDGGEEDVIDMSASSSSVL
jgi:hypothetical protein